MIVLTVAAYTLIAAYELVPLYKNKQWKDFGVNIALGACSFTVAVLISLNFEIPSPEKPIRDAVTSMFGK